MADPFLNFFARTPFRRPLADHPLVAVDVGARGGLDSDLSPLAFAVDAVGFEPEPAAFAALGDPGPWRSLRFLPVAISGTGGRRTLHVTRDTQSTTLLEPDAAVGAAFDKPQFVTVERTLAVETETLDAALAETGLSRVDYLKLDVEGAELEILMAAPRIVDQLLALKAEVCFVPVRRGQPVAADIERHLAARGFVLMDLIHPAVWRREGYIVHPHIASAHLPYSRGQIIQTDYLFFREPTTIAEPAQALRAAALAMAHGYFDHAAGLLRRGEVAAGLARDYGIDVERALRRTSLAFGRRVWATALWRHLRALSPFARSFARMVRHGRG